ncbi:unnamed protein product [Symbiodinium natans]|uniref:Uncharacterized protein n=1 Tax=Symbiodinium natans TaxID=878477 RepID=A0A812SS82_9DINO|nr:unnamed protein product [Symbiodinium natans]
MAQRRSRNLGVVVAIAVAGTWCTSFVAPSGGGEASRREALLGLAGAATAATLSSEPALAFDEAGPWLGYYSDPQHPMCPRKIVYEYDLYKDGPRDDSCGSCSFLQQPFMCSAWQTATIMVVGGDGDPGCEKKVSKRWTAKVDFKAGSDSITIDFSKKGGPADVVGKWDKDGIVFPDGNKWKKIISFTNADGQLLA